MLTYILKRLLLMIPTLVGILAINFFIAQIAPGGPVEQLIAKMLTEESMVEGSGALLSPSSSEAEVNEGPSQWKGARGLDPKFVREIEAQLGFDKPMGERFLHMLKSYVTFDLGKSFFRDQPVIEILLEKLPISISLGLWSTLLIYLLAIPLGITKAVKNGSKFDSWTSGFIIVAYAVPSLLIALLLVVVFAGGSFLQIFPLKGLVSDHFEQLSFWGKIKDYAWHMVLPTIALVIVGIANQALLVKNAFLEEIHKSYVMTAKAKGCSSRRVLISHVFRNAALVIVAHFPTTVTQMLFTGSLIIEIVFSLDGLGLLGFEAATARDYPLVLGSLYLLSLIGLVLHLLGDIVYSWVDPRIHMGKVNS